MTTELMTRATSRRLLSKSLSYFDQKGACSLLSPDLIRDNAAPMIEHSSQINTARMFP